LDKAGVNGQMDGQIMSSTVFMIARKEVKPRINGKSNSTS